MSFPLLFFYEYCINAVMRSVVHFSYFLLRNLVSRLLWWKYPSPQSPFRILLGLVSWNLYSSSMIFSWIIVYPNWAHLSVQLFWWLPLSRCMPAYGSTVYWNPYFHCMTEEQKSELLPIPCLCCCPKHFPSVSRTTPKTQIPTIKHELLYRKGEGKSITLTLGFSCCFWLNVPRVFI